MNDDIAMLRRLKIPDGIIDIVIDTDTYNEVDDQFAIVYALNSPERFRVKAINAAPFYKPEYNKRSTSPLDGMTKSYEEILKILNILGVSSVDFTYQGAAAFTCDNKTLQSCNAVDHLISLIMNNYSVDCPLFVVCIACLTNIALAIQIEPRICERMHLIWLGGTMHTANNTSEFNLHQDIAATRIVFDSNIALTQVPCFGVASHLLTTIHELQDALDLSIPINRYLFDTFRNYHDDHFAYSKEIWDIAPLAYLLSPEKWVSSSIVHRPLVTFDETYSGRSDSPFMRVLKTIDRNSIFQDLFVKLNGIKTTSRMVQNGPT